MDFSFSLIELGLMILLFIVAGLSVKQVTNKWRVLYAAPTFFALTLVILDGFDYFHIFLYLGTALQIVALFFGLGKVKQKRALAIASAAMIIVHMVIISICPGYHRLPIYDDFEKAFNTLKDHYVLTEEKGIDFDELYAKYDPLFKKIDREQDYIENYKVWQQFTREFYDGHVGYHMTSGGLVLMAFCESYGNDYGLSLARLSSGEFVAINVEGYDNSYSIDSTEHDDLQFYTVKGSLQPEDAEANRLTLKNAGIKNGTVITKWNGKSIDEYYDEVTYYVGQYPDKENEEFDLPIYVAGMGKDMNYGDTYVPGKDVESKSGGRITDNPTVDITYIDESGEEQTVTAPSLGIYAPRMYDTMNKIYDGVNVTNLTWQEINSETYMLRISEMAYDEQTYTGSDYSEMTDKLRDEILGLKELGVKKLVFDLRSNGGGSPYFVEGIAQLFAPKGEHLTYYSAVINEETATYERDENGKYKMGVPSSYVGEDLWHDGEVILLVNSRTVSAGDDMTYMMGSFPNVKIIGLTKSNSSCQAVTSVHGMEFGSLSFSAVPNLLPDGEIAIDTYTDHVGRTPFDEKIPFTQECVTAVFDNGEDYLLNYAAND